jgi:DNA-binding HxlR family transcriptional regulator
MSPIPPRDPAGVHPASEPCREEGRALCPVLAAVGVIGTEWRLVIIHRLLDGPQRFSELLRSNPRLNAKTLSATLKHLEGAGVVQRNVVSTRPFIVMYSLTEMGLGLAPAAKELRLWGERFVVPKAGSRTRAPSAPARAIPPELPPISHDSGPGRTR